VTPLAEMARTVWPYSTGMRGRIEPERVAGYAGIRTEPLSYIVYAVCITWRPF
jgi:hypothetical protein